MRTIHYLELELLYSFFNHLLRKLPTFLPNNGIKLFSQHYYVQNDDFYHILPSGLLQYFITIANVIQVRCYPIDFNLHFLLQVRSNMFMHVNLAFVQYFSLLIIYLFAKCLMFNFGRDFYNNFFVCYLLNLLLYLLLHRFLNMIK